MVCTGGLFGLVDTRHKLYALHRYKDLTEEELRQEFAYQKADPKYPQDSHIEYIWGRKANEYEKSGLDIDGIRWIWTKKTRRLEGVEPAQEPAQEAAWKAMQDAQRTRLAQTKDARTKNIEEANIALKERRNRVEAKRFDLLCQVCFLCCFVFVCCCFVFMYFVV